jgi:hypothetical protein
MICEDWFHSQVGENLIRFLLNFFLLKHLGVPLPMDENEADQMDMICQACIIKYPFLANYDG